MSSAPPRRRIEARAFPCGPAPSGALRNGAQSNLSAAPSAPRQRQHAGDSGRRGQNDGDERGAEQELPDAREERRAEKLDDLEDGRADEGPQRMGRSP